MNFNSSEEMKGAMRRMTKDDEKWRNGEKMEQKARVEGGGKNEKGK